MAKLNQQPAASVTISSSSLGATYSNTIIGGGHAVTNLAAPLTSGAGITYTNGTWGTTSANLTTSGKLDIQGDEADVIINGKSLSKTLEALEERLNILNPNPKLEQEWEELRNLGKQYRELEAKLIEQTEMWDKLKKMPPPESLY